jgi:hypothetical protein
LDWRLGIIDVLGEELEERFGEGINGLVIGLDNRRDLVCRAGGRVVSVGLRVLVCVRLGNSGFVRDL